MRTAATRSITDFRTWQFIFANLLCHEIAHLFVTFLGNTSPGTMTPPTIGCGLPGVYTDGIIKGEAGRWLEYVLFGGTFELYPDPDGQDDQAVRICAGRMAAQTNIYCSRWKYLESSRQAEIVSPLGRYLETRSIALSITVNPSKALKFCKTDKFVSTPIDFQFPYSFEGPVRYATPRQWSEEDESTFFHPVGPPDLALMAPGQSQGYDVHVGERSTVRDVPQDISARVEQA